MWKIQLMSFLSPFLFCFLQMMKLGKHKDLTLKMAQKQKEQMEVSFLHFIE